MESHSSKTQENLAAGSHRGFSGVCESTEWKTGERIDKKEVLGTGKRAWDRRGSFVRLR